MSERRALLDPEMYKISEEDSQDEEVLSGGGLASYAKNVLKLTEQGRDGWDNIGHLEERGVMNNNYRCEPPSSSTFSTAMQRLGGTCSLSKYKILEGSQARSRTGFYSGSGNRGTSLRATEGDSLDWPETSSNSDSCLSSDETSGRRGRQGGTKFLGKTYFGDHVKTLGDSFGDSLSQGGGSYSQKKNSPSRRNINRRRQRHLHHDSTSGSDSDCSGGSRSPCGGCRSGRRSNVESGGSVTSSGREDYDESSYSGSSYEGEDYADYDDEDDLEYFEDIVKFVSDTEIESNVTPDGDMFLLEYSDESEHSEVEPVEDSLNPQEPRCSLHPNAEEEESRVPENFQSGQTTSRRNDGNKVPTSSSSPSTSSPSGTNSHFQKSGKGAKGKISRLLKRKRELRQPSIDPGGNRTLPDIGELSSVNSTFLPTPLHTDYNPKDQPKQASSSKQNKPLTSPAPAPEKVFRFKDEHGGETRTVFVDIPQSRNTNLGRRATLIETILGIIPGKFSTPPVTTSGDGGQPNDRIMVAGFVPDGVASKYRRIKIGDWLLSVDDIPVCHGNVDQVLNSRSMYGKRRTAFETEYLRLKLTLKRVAGCMVSVPTTKVETSNPLKTSRRGVNSSKRKTGGGISPHVQANIALLFISTVSSNCAINETSDGTGNGSSHINKEKSKDVVFSWPKESESKIVKALAASQGMFSTLYRLLRDVTGSHPVLSKVVIDDCEMDVTYASDDNGKSLLLLAVASSLSTFTIERRSPERMCSSTSNGSEGRKREKKIRWREPQAGGVTVSSRLMTRMESLLKYQFGSLSRAFKEDSRVEKVRRLLANSISSLNHLSEDFLFLQVPGNFLRFPNCIRSGIDDVLYSFETSDALFTRDGLRRGKESQAPVFHCHGSCLMYKGFLVTSHLENELASSFHGWWRTQLGLWGLRRNTLNENWKPVSRLVLWEETFLPGKKGGMEGGRSKAKRPPGMKSQQDGFDQENQEGEGEDEPNSNLPKSIPCFSGLVGIGNFSLGFVLEHMTDYQGRVRPDVGWIRRAMTTICRLYHSGLTRSLECWVDKQERDEFVELCFTSSSSTSKHQRHAQDKSSSHTSSSSTSSKSSTPSGKKIVGTSSILKNTETIPPMLTTPQQASTTFSSPFSSSMMKNFMIGSSSLSSGNVRPGIVAPPSSHSMADELSTGVTSQEGPPDDSEGDGEDMDDTTTGTGSDTSSFKWYETGTDPNSPGGGSLPGEVKSIRVTKGSVLFDYIQIEVGRGVLLSTKDIHQGWFEVVRHNFRQSVTVIHQLLHKAANSRQRLEERGSDKKWVSRALAPISEHGILFNCQITDPRDLHKKKPRKRDIYYWVVGRIYPDEREIYVCYEDGPMSQSLVEIAYKIALNVQS